VTELRKEQNGARPAVGRAFSSRTAQIKLPGLRAQVIFWSVIVFGVALDLWSKTAVFSWLERQPDNRFTIVDGFLYVVMALSEGAAFGMATGQRCLLVAISAIAVVAILSVFLSSGTRPRLIHVALGLFAAGICGNLYDRVFNEGLVRDFIDVVYWPGRHWPAFNIADSMLCIALGLLIVSSLLTGKSSRKHAQRHK